MDLVVGNIYTGKVTGITKFGAFIELEPRVVGMVHVSEIANCFVQQVSDYLTIGQEVRVKLLAISEDKKLSLSIKKVDPPKPAGDRPRSFEKKPQAERKPAPAKAEDAQPKSENDAFESMLNHFRQSSEERISDLRRNTDGRRGSGGYASRKH